MIKIKPPDEPPLNLPEFGNNISSYLARGYSSANQKTNVSNELREKRGAYVVVRIAHRVLIMYKRGRVGV